MDEHPTEELDFDQTDFEYAMGQRNFRRQTEEERIYGIWAQDEDDERPSFGGHDSKKRKKVSTSVQFVLGGVKNASKTEEMPDVILAENEDEIIVEAIPEKKKKSTFGGGKTKMMAKDAGSQVFAGMRTATFHSTSSSTAADSAWIKSSKGNVIMQMMQKMGYEQGRGLGKSKQGIVEPVQAIPRPGRGAVGAYGSEAKGPKFGESAAEAQARIRSGADVNLFTSGVDPFSEPGGGAKWRKGNANRIRVQYRTLDDVISEGENQEFTGLATSASIGKIIDMTGPEQKVYDDFTSFSRRAKRPGASTFERTNFNIPELSHNLDTLLDVTEEEICKTDKQIRHLKVQNEVIVAEQERLEEELAESQENICRLIEVERLIRRFHQQQSKETSLEECKQLFLKLRSQYSVEFTLFGLDAIAIPILLPKISAYFSGWDPLDPEQISYGFEMIMEWREIIGNINGGALFKHFEKNKAGTLSAYDHCIWDGWMPNLRRAALVWNPRENGPVMVSLVQQWMPILPNWVVENFLEQVLVPKIKEQVDAWDPATDPVPIETWLYPWHAVMGDRLLLIYATLRQKLAKGLRNWTPGDRSAIESIRPWKNVFSTSAMHTFVSMNILPKLERSLQTINIGTTEHFDYIELFDWLGLTTVDVIAKMLAKHFFPRYYQQICFQINAPNLSMAEFEKIKQGYIDWKNLMPVEIQKHELIMTELKRVLLLIGQIQARLTGMPLSQACRSTQPIPSSHTQPTMTMPPGPFGLPPPTHFTSQLPPANFKHLVESSAISNGIQFFPQRNKKQDGKQVYMFGDFSVYIDGTLLYAYNPTRRQWLPASLNQMLDMVRNR